MGAPCCRTCWRDGGALDLHQEALPLVLDDGRRRRRRDGELAKPVQPHTRGRSLRPINYPGGGAAPAAGGAPGLHACMFKGRGSTKTQAREKGRITLFRASICAVSPTATLVLFVPCAPPDGTMLRRGGTFRVSCPVVRERKDTCPDATFTLVRYQRPLGLRRARGWWWTRHRAKTNTQLRQQCDCQLSIPQTSEQT